MSCFERFLNLPVVLQIKAPIAAVHSIESALVDVEGEKVQVGRAAVSVSTTQGADSSGKPVMQQQPVLAQVFQGTVVSVDEDGLSFETLGGDGKTQVLIGVPIADIQAISLALEHLEPEQVEQPPRIIAPN